jgi:thioesterase domain-containing protein
MRERSVSAPLPRSMLVLKEGTAARSLFLVAGGRGGRVELSLYGHLTSQLASDWTVYGLLRPARAESVEAIARDCIVAIRQVRPHGPYELGGECVGGVVAYEIARQLRAAGEGVALLMLLDSWCPTTAGVYYHRLLGHPIALAKAGFTYVRGLGKRASGESWWHELRRRASASPDEQRYISACMAYRPRSYAGRVTLLATEHSLKRGIVPPWRAVASDVRVITTPGDHETYARRHAAMTAKKLRDCVEGHS